MRNAKLTLATAMIVAACGLMISTFSAFGQGSLTPPGEPAPTMKTLGEVEPRTPITNAPCTITQSGSYYLTTNLTAGSGQDGITVNADDVTIDLNGFTLTGSGTNSGHGIYQASSRRNLRVFNGKLVHWLGSSKRGIYAYGKNSQVEHIQAATNYYGIYGGSASIISGCSAYYNLYDGINGGVGSAISDCSASYNQNYGIRSASGSAISRCSAYYNKITGISADDGSAISDCSAYYNQGDGIWGSYGSIISHCSAYYNTDDGIFSGESAAISDCTASYNVGDGIQVPAGSRVVGNTCDANGNSGDGAGIHATGNGTRIDSNHVTDNDYGITVDIAGNLIIRNSASGNGVANYNIAPTNSIGGIVDVSLGGFTNTNPWVNFEF